MSEPQITTPPETAAPLTASLMEIASKGSDINLADFRKARTAPEPAKADPPASVPDATGDSTPLKAEPDAPAEKEPNPASEAGKALAAHKSGLEKRKNRIQEEIDELTHNKHATRREFEAAQADLARVRAEMAALKSGQASPSPGNTAKPADGADPEPKEEDFEHYREFVKAQAKWEARALLAEERAAAQKTSAQRHIDQTDNRIWVDGEKKHPDFVAVVDAARDSGIELGAHISNIIRSHPQGVDLLYELAKDHALARRLAAITNPLQLGIALAPVLSRLSTATEPAGPVETVKPQTKAIVPPNPVGAAPTASLPSLATVDAGTSIDLVRRRQIKKEAMGR